MLSFAKQTLPRLLTPRITDKFHVTTIISVITNGFRLPPYGEPEVLRLLDHMHNKPNTAVKLFADDRQLPGYFLHTMTHYPSCVESLSKQHPRIFSGAMTVAIKAARGNYINPRDYEDFVMEQEVKYGAWHNVKPFAADDRIKLQVLEEQEALDSLMRDEANVKMAFPNANTSLADVVKYETKLKEVIGAKLSLQLAPNDIPMRKFKCS